MAFVITRTWLLVAWLRWFDSGRRIAKRRQAYRLLKGQYGFLRYTGWSIYRNYHRYRWYSWMFRKVYRTEITYSIFPIVERNNIRNMETDSNNIRNRYGNYRLIGQLINVSKADVGFDYCDWLSVIFNIASPKTSNLKGDHLRIPAILWRAMVGGSHNTPTILPYVTLSYSVL